MYLFFFIIAAVSAASSTLSTGTKYKGFPCRKISRILRLRQVRTSIGMPPRSFRNKQTQTHSQWGGEDGAKHWIVKYLHFAFFSLPKIKYNKGKLKSKKLVMHSHKE